MKKLHPNRRLCLAFMLAFLLCSHINAQAYQLMSTNFYIVGADGLPTLKDGNMTIYDSPFSNGIDWHDGVKMNNGGENFGIIRYGTSLAVERRQLVTGADTAYFNMWGMQIRNYRFELRMENFNPLMQAAYVWDNYLRTVQPIGFTGLTTVNFSVTADVASKAPGRFKVIYTSPVEFAAIMSAMMATMPVTMTGIQAVKKKQASLITWQVENELSMQDYVVEHSADGRSFSAIGRVSASNNAIKHEYQFTDEKGAAADYYRIRANSNDSKSSYSKTVFIKTGEADAGLVIFPNPVANKQVHVKINETKSATYKLTLADPAGKMRALQSLSVNAGQTEAVIGLPAGTNTGIYQLRFIANDNSVITRSIFVL